MRWMILLLGLWSVIGTIWFCLETMRVDYAMGHTKDSWRCFFAGGPLIWLFVALMSSVMLVMVFLSEFYLWLLSFFKN